MVNEIQTAQDIWPELASAEHEAWCDLSMKMLARAYGEDEPEYTTDMLKWVNPDYEGK